MVFLRQAENTYHKYFNGIHKDDTTFLMRFIKMTVVKGDFFWISKAHKTDHLLS